MKKVLSIVLSLAALCSLCTTTFAASGEISTDTANIAAVAESNSIIVGEYKQYTPFTVNNREVILIFN